MSIFKYFSRSYVDQRVAEIRAEGAAEASKLWKEWNSRWMAAEPEGRDFTGPPPAVKPGEARNRSARNGVWGTVVLRAASDVTIVQALFSLWPQAASISRLTLGGTRFLLA